MKFFMIGIMTLISVSAFASELPKQCNDGSRPEASIENHDNASGELDLIYIYADHARDLYLKINGAESVKVIGETHFLTKKLGQIYCLRQDRKELVTGNDCSSYQCVIAVIQ